MVTLGPWVATWSHWTRAATRAATEVTEATIVPARTPRIRRNSEETTINSDGPAQHDQHGEDAQVVDWGVWMTGAAEVAATSREGITGLLPWPARVGPGPSPEVSSAGIGVRVTRSTWTTSWLTDGVIRSSTGLG